MSRQDRLLAQLYSVPRDEQIDARKRRFDELIAKGGKDAEGITFESTLEDVRRRDAQDMGRAVAPLKQADGAILVESSTLSIDETVLAMAAHVKKRMQ